jgi:S1-C subfamily serine protease
MQAGEYRHALSAAAHTHAEHPDVEDSALLYAWLLAIGGQTTPAITLLEATLEYHPQNAALILMHKQIKASQLISAELKTSKAIQLKPFTSEKFVTVKPHKYLTTGVVINRGNHIITTIADVENATTLHVRDGLGREIMAHIEQKIPSAKLAVLKLDKPVKTISALTIADKSPFPGTPIYIIGFSPLNQDQADWPQLRVDILGTPTAANHDGYPLHARFAPKGAGVFNQQGHLVGIVDGRSAKVMLPLTDNALTAYKKSSYSTDPLATLPMDEIYERALINTVQVLGSE